METHNIMNFKAMLLLLLVSIVLAKADLDPSTILKTIVSGTETIDCVDIYKQPAFNHPLLKNHTLQSKPSSYPAGLNSRVSAKLTQKWHESEEFCPEGTVPILRKPAKNTTSNDDNPEPWFTKIEWGGKATKLRSNEITQMGSGHFSGEGFGKAAYVANLEYADGNGNWIKVPVDVQTVANRPDCYDIKSPEDKDGFGTLFYYGGDGKACFEINIDSKHM
ncbi:hypothetical protein LINPERHAP2_LOCUS14068 [Linum perenne]